MVLLVSVLFGIQALCSWAASPPAREATTALLSPTCDDTAVEEAADLALRQINADRKEGYILSLYRIFSVREYPQEITGSVFYLILDVVDTECHVLSKKLWKNCTARLAHETVYGQCKAIIYINQARNIAHLNTYECILQPVPPRYIWSVCPDCPVDDCPTEPKYLEAAVQSLAKFNEKSEQPHYFSVLNVTRASMQWVVGPAHFVEFLIQETSCSKNDTIADISKCKPLPLELARIGFCKGSVVTSHVELKQFITISCELYGLQDPATEEEKQQPNKTPGKSNQNDQQAFPSETNRFSPHLEKTVGWVKILPPSTEDISFQNPLESQNEHKDGKTVPPEMVGSMPSLDGAKTQADKPDLTKPVTGPVILPFPEELSLSDSCPGEAKKTDSILQPLLPKKPTKV
ncbi:fetuin-B [Balearica regulorum gibbericeps]|uniref:fetuin-B n=1 Tax=Balearica regulorum gibbericeps TaxID=100784 RepID=UPI0005324E89|nr:PREDICTED: fetuin-B [Balearica regulorum gibbericeps]